ncbi:hypothetical protein SPSYN_01150 [Sporotomaculum syntrophicum]|uniref:Uncharacterized protein n=1 Tax=Sporotomaculum syntrophicum TaxID=182264 RepID=A0A9D2WPF4_9FIRM|nr:hypothetical protein SPSYN_01150 [Sporotomaculum syntrophicum]
MDTVHYILRFLIIFLIMIIIIRIFMIAANYIGKQVVNFFKTYYLKKEGTGKIAKKYNIQILLCTTVPVKYLCF